MENQLINLIFEATEAVTGVTRGEVCSRSRTQRRYFARMIAAHELRRLGLSFTKIAELLDAAGPSTVIYQTIGYRDERTPYFRRCAAEVAKLLSDRYAAAEDPPC